MHHNIHLSSFHLQTFAVSSSLPLFSLFSSPLSYLLTLSPRKASLFAPRPPSHFTLRELRAVRLASELIQSSLIFDLVQNYYVCYKSLIYRQCGLRFAEQLSWRHDLEECSIVDRMRLRWRREKGQGKLRMTMASH